MKSDIGELSSVFRSGFHTVVLNPMLVLKHSYMRRLEVCFTLSSLREHSYLPINLLSYEHFTLLLQVSVWSAVDVR